MRLERALGAALCCLLGACLGAGPGAVRTGAEASLPPDTVVVRAEDTLYSIAWRHDLDYRDLAKWNGLGTDYRLAVGQVLRLRPGAAPRAATAAPTAQANEPAARAPRAPRAPRASPAPPPSPSPSPSPASPASPASVSWVWPTALSAAPVAVAGGGILLPGVLGQEVCAAGAGKVVYTGNGLRGYGNLIIIKHGDSLLSSYAHNRDLLVQEGDAVSAGQVIAHMGTGPHQQSALYFEIRRNGKPTDPRSFLPDLTR